MEVIENRFQVLSEEDELNLLKESHISLKTSVDTNIILCRNNIDVIEDVFEKVNSNEQCKMRDLIKEFNKKLTEYLITI